MSRADSIRMTASIAAFVLASVTPPDHTTGAPAEHLATAHAGPIRPEPCGDRPPPVPAALVTRR
jgi:hypothetical protein